MLLLPPAAPASGPDRRIAARRAGDRRKRVSGQAAEFETIAPEAVAAAPAAEPEPDAGAARRRRGGRRKTDRIEVEEPSSASARVQRPHAPLVAQLIATALNLEQTRVRRRGTVEQATELYRRKPPRPKPRGEA